MRVLFLTSVISGPGGMYREGREYEISESLAKGWLVAGFVRPVAPAIESAASPRIERSEKALRPLKVGRQERSA